MRDRRVLFSHPLRIENRIQQIAVKEYKRITATMPADEKEWRTQELAERTHETLGDAIDQLEKELDYTPIKFLGKFALYPDTLKSILTTILTVAFALFQSNYVAPAKAENEAAAKSQ